MLNMKYIIWIISRPGIVKKLNYRKKIRLEPRSTRLCTALHPVQWSRFDPVNCALEQYLFQMSRNVTFSIFSIIFILTFYYVNKYLSDYLYAYLLEISGYISRNYLFIHFNILKKCKYSWFCGGHFEKSWLPVLPEGNNQSRQRTKIK